MLTKPTPLDASTDSIRQYLNEIGRIPRISSETEILLGRQVFWMMAIRNIRLSSDIVPNNEQVAATLNTLHRKTILKQCGKLFTASDIQILERKGRIARDRMLEANLRLVVSIAKRTSVVGMSLADLIQEGTLGLNRGIEGFDPELGYKLSTYATWWIRQAITRAIADRSRIIRLPIPFAEKIRRIKKLEKLFAQNNGRSPRQHEILPLLIADGLIADENHYEQIMLKAMSVSSLNQSGNTEDDSELLEMQQCPNSFTGEQAIIREPLRQDLELIISTLAVQQQLIIRLRYGMSGLPVMNVKQISEYFGGDPTRDEVRSLETSAMRIIRDNRNKRILAAHR